MAQFDVYRNPRGGRYPFLLDVQADLLERLATRVVVPLITPAEQGEPISVLNPSATIDGLDYVLAFQELAAIPASALGEPVTSLSSRRDELAAAVDLLFAGI